MATRIETYVPLYRKYRPQSFGDMVGQEAIMQTLGNAINLSKVAHAYLFCGPRGTGKTSTARIFAKSLNCEQGPTTTPCQTCASCVGVTAGNALDVIEFDAASNNGVDDARELIENAQYSPMSGRFKIYIIDEVHMLSPSAFNALLKTLEEPPPNVIFIFATTEAHKVLPTIISRCQRFDFNRITNEDIMARLHFIADTEQIAIDEEAVAMIARHARGGLRDAVGLLDQVSVLGRAQADKVIGRKDVALFIGTLEEDLLLRMSDSIAERRAADLLNQLGELTNRGIEPIQLLKDLTMHFRNLLLVQAAGPQAKPDQLSLPEDYFQALVQQTSLFTEMEELPQIIGRLSFIERNIRNSSQPQLWLEVGLIDLAYRHEIHVVKELSERVAQLEAQLAGGAPLRQSAPARPMEARPQAPAHAPVQTQAPAMSGSIPSGQSQTGPTADSSFQPQAPVAQMPQSSPVNASPAQPAANPSQPALTPSLSNSGNIHASYKQICASVASPTAKSLLQQHTFILSHEDTRLLIGCSSEPTLNLLKKPDKFIHLQKAVDKFFGLSMKIDLILEKKAPTEASIPAASGPARPAAAQEIPSASVTQGMSSSVADMFAAQPTMPTSTTTQAVLERQSVEQAPASFEMAGVTTHPVNPSIAPTELSTTTNAGILAPNPGPNAGSSAVETALPEASVFGMDPAGFGDEDGPEEDLNDRFEDDEEDEDEMPVQQAAPAFVPGTDFEDAKKYTLELLQGKVIE